MPGSAFSARFYGPHVIESKINELDYVIKKNLTEGADIKALIQTHPALLGDVPSRTTVLEHSTAGSRGAAAPPV